MADRAELVRAAQERDVVHFRLHADQSGRGVCGRCAELRPIACILAAWEASFALCGACWLSERREGLERVAGFAVANRCAGCARRRPAIGQPLPFRLAADPPAHRYFLCCSAACSAALRRRLSRAATALGLPRSPRTCAGCGKAAAAGCAYCRLIAYCGGACARAAWPAHVLGCAALPPLPRPPEAAAPLRRSARIRRRVQRF